MFFSILLSSCEINNELSMPNPTVERSDNIKNEKYTAFITMNIIIDAINNKNRKALLDLFSKSALNQSEDVDENIEELFMILNKKIKPLSEDDISPGSTSDYNNGKITTELFCWQWIENIEKTFVLKMVEYTECTDEPDKVGLWSIEVVCNPDERNGFADFSMLEHSPGVNITN